MSSVMTGSQKVGSSNPPTFVSPASEGRGFDPYSLFCPHLD